MRCRSVERVELTHIEQQGLAGTFDLRDGALQIKRLCQEHLEDLLHVDRVAGGAKNQWSLHGLAEPSSLFCDFVLFLSRERGVMVVLGADEEWNRGLVEPARLPVPLLDRVQRGFAREVEHEKDGNCVVADEWKHVDKLALTAQIPDAKRDFRVADRNGLFHKVDSERLDVVLVERAFDVTHHERRFADLRVAYHAHFQDHTVGTGRKQTSKPIQSMVSATVRDTFHNERLTLTSTFRNSRR